MHVTGLGIHGFAETLAVDEPELRVYWRIESPERGARQTAYRIRLDLTDAPGDPRGAVWDSDWVDCDATRDIALEPEEPLLPTTAYRWSVAVRDERGRESTSDPAFFHTGYQNSHAAPPLSPNRDVMPDDSLLFRSWFADPDARWKGRWIGTTSDRPFYVRREFELDETPVRAIAFATGLGHLQFFANGAPASDHRLDPGWTDYHQAVQYAAYDLTGRIAAGRNALGAHVGNGFYAGEQGDRFFWPLYEDKTYVRYGNELPFVAELHLTYADGRRETVISDQSWRIRESATTLANVYASEDHDRRLFPTGWTAAGFDDSEWRHASFIQGPRGHLRYQSQPALTAIETRTPVEVTEPRPGTLVFDLGQNMSTMVELSAVGDAGDRIVVRYGETLGDDGVLVMPDPEFSEFGTHVYSTFTLAGTGEPETWQPDFSYAGARWVQLEGVAPMDDDGSSGLPRITDVRGHFVSSASPRTGTMTTDVDDANAILAVLEPTFASNLQSLHTDCPQIEKFGWLEVVHLLANGTQYIRDVEDLYTKILRDVMRAQDSDGLVPTMAPEIRYMTGPFRDSIAWGSAIVYLPKFLVDAYDSTGMLAEAYPAAARYMSYLQGKEVLGGIIRHGLGDWGVSGAYGNGHANLETAIYIDCLRIMASFADRLGRLADAVAYRNKASEVTRVYNDHLLEADPETGRYRYVNRDGLPTSITAVNQAAALQFGLVPPEHRADVVAAFLDEADKATFETGEIGMRYLFLQLADLKRSDIWMRMARREEHPSYMRFIRRGETTLPEFWADEVRSKNHDMLGHALEYFWRGVLGLRSLESAYRVFAVDPDYTGEFASVSADFASPRGTISLSIDRGAQSTRIHVTVPANTSAVVTLPAYATTVAVNGEPASAISPDASAATLSLTSGDWRIETEGTA
ncbi:family 78 glycoside hydrolase catalytic domain [Agreia sp. PsM10]|uniref:family 78 glycoside hydrolase catalytic domain n=1 Tax=Agreia sp. PsM10 TaxID=3030533 RepID=UPI00263A71A7|nr:family 78 glycoside hydrolase catalytic domain [Agreia sp. PsM10]MDN4640005.1 family 78 glycoside hydrolase catalytic domain [Agreia sp. PsM10]